MVGSTGTTTLPIIQTLLEPTASFRWSATRSAMSARRLSEIIWGIHKTNTAFAKICLRTSWMICSSWELLFASALRRKGRLWIILWRESIWETREEADLAEFNWRTSNVASWTIKNIKGYWRWWLYSLTDDINLSKSCLLRCLSASRISENRSSFCTSSV